MANIIFITYHDFTSNSAIQIHTFANHLVKLGHTCIVAVPSNKHTVYDAIGGDVLYTPFEFSEIRVAKNLFQDGRGPDIVHAWTPREIVRKECIPLVKRYKCKLIVHLEDNEEQILSDHLCRTIQQLRSCSEKEISSMTPDHLSHLYYYKDFLKMADGITIIMDRLSEFIPENKEYLVLWPGVDCSRFDPERIDKGLKRSFGIDDDVVVLCYTGNVHASNYQEVRSLYLAVALLNRVGIPTRLIRTGVDHVPFLGDGSTWAHQYSIELGFVPHEMISDLLRVADILVQPGKADDFNAYRLPSKLPEFFYMRKPVILPRANIGRFIIDGKEGILLNGGGAIEIVEKIQEILKNPALAAKLSHHAEEFAKRSFDIDTNTKELDSFYKKIMSSHSDGGRSSGQG